MGLVNGRGREDTCSIIRPDKEARTEGRIEGRWEDDGAFIMLVLFIISHFCLVLGIIVVIQIKMFSIDRTTTVDLFWCGTLVVVFFPL